PEAMQAGFPALGGVGSARALAKFYSLFATVSDAIPNRIHGAASNALVNGEDAVLLLPTSFAAGFMMDPVNLETEEKRRAIFGSSKKAFGHPGAGGSLGFADPENGIAFAYVMNHLSYGVLPNVKAREMVDAIYT
ncbi:MAG: serine hydrolase domain-containing protein, partial [Verrucomicrobiota bacterium]